jgi:hypothetical protein
VQTKTLRLRMKHGAGRDFGIADGDVSDGEGDWVGSCVSSAYLSCKPEGQGKRDKGMRPLEEHTRLN